MYPVDSIADIVSQEFPVGSRVEVWPVGDETPTINGTVARIEDCGLVLDPAETSTRDLGRVFMPWPVILIRAVRS